MNKTISFSLNKLIINNGDPVTFALFEPFKGKTEDPVTIHTPGEGERVIGVKIVNTEISEKRFVSIHTLDGDMLPYAPEVVDIKDMSTKKNPRSQDEVEPDDACFVLVDCSTGTLFLSKQRARKEVEEWLHGKTGQIITIKPLIKEEEFEEQLERINEISLSLEADPLIVAKKDDSLEAQLKRDAFGYGAERAELRFIYNKTVVTDIIKEKIHSLIKRRSKNLHVSMIGKSVDGYESVLNMSEITSRVGVAARRDRESGQPIVGELFAQLISLIKKKEVQ